MSLKLDIRAKLGTFELSVDFELPSQGVTAVFGPSGSGKTTLLRSIAGLETSLSGKIQFHDRIFHDGRQSVSPHKRNVGYVFQQPALFAHLNVMENIEYGFSRTPEPDRTISLDEVIHLTGVSKFLTQKPSHLSGGERQRVAIARALAASPGLLLMDEPVSALDASSRSNLLRMLEDLLRKIELPTLYVTHDWKEVLRLADRVVFLDSGRVVTCGEIPDILQESPLPIPEEQAGVSLVEATVDSIDSKFGLSRFSFPGGNLIVPGTSRPVGEIARILIDAQDVSLTLSPTEGSSILNILPAEVTRIEPVNDHQARVILSLEGSCLRAAVTRKSVLNLDLKPGDRIYAQIKSVALFP